MQTNELYTEEIIFQAANDIFLLYGYHASTLNQIATQAGVHKSAIHYYYRSKEKLYSKVVMFVLEAFLKCKMSSVHQKIVEKQSWFLFTELYNNQDLFIKTLKELYLGDWDEKLHQLKDLLKIKE